MENIKLSDEIREKLRVRSPEEIRPGKVYRLIEDGSIEILILVTRANSRSFDYVFLEAFLKYQKLGFLDTVQRREKSIEDIGINTKKAQKGSNDYLVLSPAVADIPEEQYEYFKR